MLAARKQARDSIGPDCHGTVQTECTQDHVHIVLTALEIFWIFTYCVLFHKYILQEFRRLSMYVQSPLAIDANADLLDRFSCPIYGNYWFEWLCRLVRIPSERSC